MNKQPDGANLIAAMVLCLIVLIGWQYMFEIPQQAERERLAAERSAQTGQTQPAAPGAPAAPAMPATPLSRDAALASAPRISFDNEQIDGSIRVAGTRIDDLRLKKYHETIDPGSPEVVFLSPAGTKGATYADVGWTAAPGLSTSVPGEATPWTVAGSAKLTPSTPVTLTWDNGGGLVFTRTLSLDRNYMFTVTDKVENRTSAPVTLYPYAIVSREGQPEAPPNWILHEGLVGVLEGSLKEETYASMLEAQKPEIRFAGSGGWLGITDKYWMATLVPPQAEKFEARFSVVRDAARDVFRTDYLLGARNVAPGAAVSVTHHVFAGAKVVSLIEDYQRDLGIFRFDMTIDWGWFSVITYWMFVLLDWLNKLTGNFGVAIILLTVVVKAVFYPLANRSYESMTKMKKVQPQIKELQERYKDDRVKLQQEQMALFSREKINPLMGCLPILIQIPVFFSLYKVLFVTIEMRHAPFFGWITDLAAADPTSLFNLFGLLPYDVPQWLQIGVWPLLMGLTMWFQTQMSPPPTDPTQRQVMIIMPPLFTYLMASFPAGLVVYWTVNNVLSIAQQYMIMRRMHVELDLSDSLGGWVKHVMPRKQPPAPPGG